MEFFNKRLSYLKKRKIIFEKVVKMEEVLKLVHSVSWRRVYSIPSHIRIYVHVIFRYRSTFLYVFSCKYSCVHLSGRSKK